jgi:DNA-binding MarR family transcriptional regulator
MIELKVLQAIRLKGRVTPGDVAGTVDEEPSAIDAVIRSAVDAGYLVEGKTLRVSAEGRARLEALLAEERAGVDHASVSDAYADFRAVNADFKQLIAQWQMKDGQPNAHDDAGYDSAVLTGLAGVHQRVGPLLDRVAADLPRLANYRSKLDVALQRVDAGETAWLTRPIVDSYHTVWFELHEELILAAGLTRADEAKAGHAH